MLQSKLLEYLYGDSIFCIIYFINIISLVSLNLLLINNKLYKKQPFLDHLRNFACLCFITTYTVNKPKFESSAAPCIILGYPTRTKKYKVMHLTTCNIILSRNVYFHDLHFPCHMISADFNKSTYPHYVFLPSSTTPHDDLEYPHLSVPNTHTINQYLNNLMILLLSHPYL